MCVCLHQPRHSLTLPPSHFEQPPVADDAVGAVGEGAPERALARHILRAAVDDADALTRVTAALAETDGEIAAVRAELDQLSLENRYARTRNPKTPHPAKSKRSKKQKKQKERRNSNRAHSLNAAAATWPKMLCPTKALRRDLTTQPRCWQQPIDT